MVNRNFSNFHLGDNVYELADGLVPEIAERVDVKLGNEPNSQALSDLVRELGPNPALRSNPDPANIDRRTAVELAYRSHLPGRMSRSLWTPDIKPQSNRVSTGDAKVDAAVLTGATANWQNRAASIVPFGIFTYIAAGTRKMDTETEINHPDVQRLKEFGRYPTEAEYAASIIIPKLTNSHVHSRFSQKILMTSYPTESGEELASRFFEDNQHLLDKRLLFIRAATGGVQLAVQMRKAARALSADFDADKLNPQVFIETDSQPIAMTPQEETQPRFQKGSSALRQIAVTAKLLHEAAGGE